MPATVKTIASALGISPSAVSLALNGRPGVSEETRARVIKEADRLGYAPKSGFVAQKNIRYVIFQNDRTTVVNETPFYSHILEGIEIASKDYGYNVLVSYFRASEDWPSQIKACFTDVAGVILLATELEDIHFRLFDKYGMNRQGIPFVLVDNYLESSNADCIISDNIQGARKAVEHLHSCGYKSLGYVRSKYRIDNFGERQMGFNEATSRFHDIGPTKYIDVDISSEGAFVDMCNWLDSGNKPPRGIFAENDVIAAACIRALKTRGYSIPEDVAIVGYDDIPICTMVDPPISTIQVQKTQMGSQALKALHERILERESTYDTEIRSPFRIVISTKLVRRESA